MNGKLTFVLALAAFLVGSEAQLPGYCATVPPVDFTCCTLPFAFTQCLATCGVQIVFNPVTIGCFSNDPTYSCLGNCLKASTNVTIDPTTVFDDSIVLDALLDAASTSSTVESLIQNSFNLCKVEVGAVISSLPGTCDVTATIGPMFLCVITHMIGNCPFEDTVRTPSCLSFIRYVNVCILGNI